MYKKNLGYLHRYNNNSVANSSSARGPLNPLHGRDQHFTTHSLPPVTCIPLNYRRNPTIKTISPSMLMPAQKKNISQTMAHSSTAGSPIIQAQPGNIPLSDSDEETEELEENPEEEDDEEEEEEHQFDESKPKKPDPWAII